MTDIALESPLELPCGVVLCNRILKSAMNENLASLEHVPGVEYRRLYERWAHSGASLCVTGNVMIDRDHLVTPRCTVLDGPEQLGAFASWARATKGGSAALWMQLNHPGRQAPALLQALPVAPSAVEPAPHMRDLLTTPRALSHAEIIAIIERFATSARLAKSAGFAGVQLHAAHGFLLSQFLSPHYNRRRDGWGGSLRRRSRMLLETYRAVRAAVGHDYPVAIKLNASDYHPHGLKFHETRRIAAQLADEGLDLLELSGGTYENPVMSRGHDQRSGSYFRAFAHALKHSVRAPIALTGGFHDSLQMRRAIASGTADMVGLGRAMCLEPELPRRALEYAHVTVDVSPKLCGIARIDRTAMLEVTWYEQQLERLAHGRAPQPQRSPLTSFVSTAVSLGAQLAGRRLAKSLARAA